MTHQRTLTAAHWGVYEVEYDDKGQAARLHPFSKDPDPSPIGLHMLSDEVARLRVRRPSIRKSWLEKGPGAATDKRGAEPFVEVPWDEALDLVANEIKRQKRAYCGVPCREQWATSWKVLGRLPTGVCPLTLLSISNTTWPTTFW